MFDRSGNGIFKVSPYRITPHYTGQAKVMGFYFMKKVAILVDGGFYRKQALFHFGEKTPKGRADELVKYCRKHLINRSNYKVIKDSNGETHRKYQINDLYKIFYYDCPSISKTLYHPLLRKNVDFSKTETYQWMNDFLDFLIHKRKLALRLGILADKTASYGLKEDIIKKVFSGKLKLEDITEKDFTLILRQKGVDMKIGIDITTLAYKKLVDQIVLISGDSDFVPAVKIARREGIDFIVDSMGHNITNDLIEHIDGFQSYYKDTKFRN